MIALPDPDEIRHLFDRKDWSRGQAYARRRRVLGMEVEDETVIALVAGSRPEPYEVHLRYRGGRLDAACSCPIGAEGDCKHVVAVLVSWAEDTVPALAPPEPAPGDGRSKEEIRAWAEAAGIADLLGRRVVTVMNVGYHSWLWRADATVLEVAAADGLSPRGRLGLGEVRERVLAHLEEVAGARRRALDYESRAAEWRERAPEPALQPLWERLLRERRDLCEEVAPNLVDLRDVAQLRWEEDPPRVGMAAGLAERVGLALQPAPGDPLVEGPSATARLYLVDLVLDLMTCPEAPAEPRRQLERLVAWPAWRRALDQLDRVVDHALRDAPEGWELGWRLSGAAGHWQLEAVECTPYKTREGLRTRRRALSPLDAGRLPLPADRDAARLLASADVDFYRADRVNRALLRLAGHPRLLDADGMALAVRPGALDLAWEPLEDGAVEVRARIDEEPVPAELVRDLVASFGADRMVHLDARRRRVVLVEASPATRDLLELFHKRGWTWPAEAVPDLLERADRIARHVPIALGGHLRGEALEPDLRPLLRLEPSPDGAIELDVLARPLVPGPAFRPARGPAEVSVVRDGRRVYVPRDRAAEPDRFRAVLAGLALGPSEEWSWTLADPEQALTLLEQLQERAEEFQVEWARPRPRIVPAGATALQVRAKEQRDWFGLEGGLEIEGEPVPLGDLLAAIRAGRRYVRVSGRAWAAITQPLHALLEELAEVGYPGRQGVELSPLAAGALAPLEEAGVLEVPRVWRVSMGRMREAATLDPPLPPGLVADLRPYQREGFRWLARLAHWSRGACLADDMGLGKTLQALALLLHRASGPALVVAPASVGGNWEREAARFAPGLRVRAYRGPDRRALLDQAGPSDVLVTSYQLLRLDAEALAARRFTTVVLDEAQAIKNAATRGARAAAGLDAGFVLALTGTPVENRVGELWSLFRVLAPGLLGNRERFRQRFAVPIEREEDAARRRALAKVVRPFLLRRVKSEVATELPERTEVVVRVDLSDEERTLYDTFRASVHAAMEDPGEDHRFQLLAALTRLRQLACHPRLVDRDHPLERSAKLEALLELVDEVRAGGHRALVFSQFTTLLEIVRQALDAAGVRVLQLDGTTPVARRQELVDAFQRGEADVFLISLKAGGTGLNLTAASYVVHLDPWWNPAVEDQATDRAHRIGQTDPVTVYRLVAAGTVEEAVLGLHESKRALAADLLEGTHRAALATDELLALIEGGAGSALVEPA